MASGEVQLSGERMNELVRQTPPGLCIGVCEAKESSALECCIQLQRSWRSAVAAVKGREIDEY